MKYNTFKKGAVGGMLALALITQAVPAPRAEAATLDELQAQIQTLLAQLEALKGNTPGTSNLGSCNPFTTDMTVGRSGVEVTNLQKFLISKGHSIPAGATGYFGEQTRAALAQFQSQHGITPAIGYFGPQTRGKVNALCTPSTPTTPTTPGGTSGNGNPQTPVGGLRGEVSLESFKVSNGDDTNLEENQKDASVMDIEFEVKDGDALINRVDLGFRPGSTNNEMDPWDTFAEVTLYNGDKRIGRVDASNEDNWEEDSPSNGEYRLRLNGLNWVVKEGDSVNLTARVSVQKNVRGANDGESWTIFIPTNGIRGLDADRASVFIGDSADSVTFDIDEAGSEDELIVKRSDKDPDATTLQLEDNTRSEWTKVFAFDLDTDGSTNGIEIRKIPVDLTVSSGTVETYMRDIRLVVDGKKYTKKTTTDGTTSRTLFDFKSNELMIDAGERVTVEVEVEFNQLSDENQGVTIVGSVDPASIVAEGADNLTGSQLSGSATGEVHTLRTSGAIVDADNTTSISKANSNTTLNDDEGVYSLKFNVTAFNSDLYIPQSVDRGTTLGTSGANFIIEDASAGSIEVASGTAVATLDSDARVEDGFFKVSEGQTKTFTLMVEYDPESKAFYKVQLYSLNWNDQPAAPTVQQRILPEGSYETSVLSISN